MKRLNNVSKEDAISTFRLMFDIKDGSKSKESDGKFMIIKTEFERFHVINKLNEWFESNVISGYFVQIESLTVLFTTFQILPIELLPLDYKSKKDDTSK
jgi:hypothetical protein